MHILARTILFLLLLLTGFSGLFSNSLDTLGTSTIRDTMSQSICNGETVGTFSQSGIYVLDTTTINGICTIKYLNLTVYPKTLDTYELVCIEMDDPQTTGRFETEMTDSNGCPYTQVIDVRATPDDIFHQFSLCDGESYTTENGTRIDTTGVYVEVISDMGPCTYEMIWDVTFIIQEGPIEVTEFICEGDTLWQYGLPLTEPDTYFISWIDYATSCPADFIIHLIPGVPSTIVGDTLVCGSEFSYGSVTIDEPGTYNVPYIGNQLCVDSIELTVNFREIETIEISQCQDYQTAPGQYVIEEDSCRITLLTVHPRPEEIHTDTTICAGDTLLWNGNLITGFGYFYGEQLDENGCTGSASLFVSLLPATACTVSTEDLLYGTVYPNPFTDRLHIDQLALSSTFQIELVEPSGKTVFQQQINNNGPVLIPELASGLYMLIIRADDKLSVTPVYRE